MTEVLTSLTTITCGECGIAFSLPETRRLELVRTGEGFYCPNGHCRAYKPSEVEKLTKERDQLREQLTQATSSIAAQRKRADDARSHYRCPFDDCPYWASRRHFLRMHIEKHHDVKSRKRLPANAGPSQ